jgi:hypothetical protein
MKKSTVMVALRDAEHVDSLMKVACKLSNGAKSNLVALHVLEVAPTLPLDADPEILDRPGKQVLSWPGAWPLRDLPGRFPHGWFGRVRQVKPSSTRPRNMLLTCWSWAITKSMGRASCFSAQPCSS